MKSEFNKRYKLLEEKREQLFSELKKHSDEVLNKKPSPDKWSVMEVIQHLMKGEGASLMYLQKKTLDVSKASKTGFKNKWRYFILDTVFSLPLKFKAPQITSPKNDFVTLEELDKKWDKIRKEILEITDKINEKDFDKELWRHIISGKMNLLQMVDFFTIHFDRHREQIDRTLKIVNS